MTGQLGAWTRTEAAERAARTMVVLPIGALEQHGPHLPLATDTLLVQYVAQAAVDSVADQVPAVVAPPLPYGYSHHHLPFGGTASMGIEQLLGTLRGIVGSLLDSGFGAVFILNGHGGNQEIVSLVARDVGLSRGAYVGAGSYFEMARPALLAAGAQAMGEIPGHAGVFETSLMLAAHPELVQLSEAPRRQAGKAVGPSPVRTARTVLDPSAARTGSAMTPARRMRSGGPGPWRCVPPPSARHCWVSTTSADRTEL
jgi:creatinine amidohydrolase